MLRATCGSQFTMHPYIKRTHQTAAHGGCTCSTIWLVLLLLPQVTWQRGSALRGGRGLMPRATCGS
jgi:hypothetical protein